MKKTTFATFLGKGAPVVSDDLATVQRQCKIAFQQWEAWKLYALELQERLLKYEPGPGMHLNKTKENE